MATANSQKVAEEKRHLLRQDATEDDKEVDSTTAPLSLSYKLTRLLVQFLMWCSIGAYSEITGPVIPELIVQTRTNYELMLQAISMRGAGHITGGIIGGLLVDRLLRHIDIFGVVLTALYIIFGVLAGYVTSIELMFFVLLVQGTLETIVNIVGYRVIFITFRERSAAACNVIQFGYNLGATLAPIIAAPFVDERFSGTRFTLDGRLVSDGNATNQSISLLEYSDDEPTTFTYPAKFVNAYWIVAGFGILAILLHLSLHIYGERSGVQLVNYLESEVKPSVREQFKLRACSPSHPVLAALFLLMMFVHVGCNFALGRVFPKVIFSYDRDGPGLSVSMSSLMTSSFFMTSLVGIPLFLIPSYFIHVKYLLQVQASLMLITSLLLYFLYRNTTALWILFIIQGLAGGPIVACGFGMINHYIEMTSVAQMVPQLGVALADILVMFAVGYSYENIGPYTIWSHLLALSGIIFTVVTVMQILGYLHGDRYAPKAESSEAHMEQMDAF